MQRPVRAAVHSLGAALCALGLLLAAALPAMPQAGPAPSPETVRQLLLAVLLEHFDPASVFDISPEGVGLSGGILSIEDLLIVAKPGVVRGVQGEGLLKVTGLYLDMAALASRQVKIARFGQATLTAATTARDLALGLTRISPDIQNPVVRLEAGQFEFQAMLKRGDRVSPVQMRGTLVVEGGQRVSIAIIQAQVEGGDVPLELVRRELDRFNPILDLSRWPLNLHIQRLILHNDRLEVLATGGTPRP